MIELSVNKLSKFYGANQILKEISFDIKSGERVGLIGQNGCGKTTIFKILMGMEEYQSGEISFRKGARMGYLNQIPEFGEGITVQEVLEGAFEELYRMKHKLQELERQFAYLQEDKLNRALELYGKLTEQYERSGGYETEIRLHKTTEGLQINDVMLQLPFDCLSGGEKTRVILAKILLEEPDILLLDEPSNHLDLAAVEWLEGFLRDYRGTVLVISHDRYFLDAVVTRTIELFPDHAELYQGNYSYYVAEKERRFILALKNYQNEQKKIERMEEQIARYRIWGEMRDSEKMFKRAKELEKRLEKMDTPVKPELENRKIRLNQKTIGRSGKLVLETEGAGVSFGDKELLKDISFTLFYQDSACILGRNGCGKSTFLKLVVGELTADRGELKLGAQVRIGYLPQQVTFEDENQTILEYFSRLHNITTGEARSLLAKALFLKEDVNKKIRFLSGGEKSRLKLCSLTYEGANFLILDEPTNHLDIDSREVLEETLMSFPGTLLFVSHDRYFINKVADRILTLEEGSMQVYEGDYSYYQEESKKAAARRADEASSKEPASATQERASKNLSGASKTLERAPKVLEAVPKTLRKTHNKQEGTMEPEASLKQTAGRAQINGGAYGSRKLRIQLEAEIETLEARKRELEELMEISSTDAIRLKELFEELQLTEDRLTVVYEEWDRALAAEELA